MRLGVIGNVNPNTFCRAFVGTRAQITAANLTNVGSETSFSILPTYRKVAIWFRQA